MPIKSPLLFHFNQHLTEYALLASRTCYRGLLGVLLNAPVKTSIHISGTLVQALQWLDPAPLDMIRKGIASGRFELVGSTHAQNVPYATSDADNAAQIALHHDILQNAFDVRPTTFWNPERCWRQSLLPVIAGAGYQTITLEDHILDAAGAVENQVFETSVGTLKLQIARDDGRFKDRFNFAAWFGDPQPLFDYLQAVEHRSPENPQYLVYAEDAEAMGLWGYHQDVVPQQTWDRLAALLDQLAAASWFEAVHFRDLPPANQTIEQIPDGAAAWMNASLADPGRPYHEDGYADWFEFNARSNKLREFRAFYDLLRAGLENFPAETDGQKRLRALALHAYLTHQYEFGCIGIGDHDSPVWRGAEAAAVLAAIGKAPANSRRRMQVLGETIGLHSGRATTALLTPHGGRMLYWADRDTGTLMVGNPGAVAPGPYISFAAAPPDIRYPAFLVPEERDYEPYVIAEPPPTRMRKFLPEELWDGYAHTPALAVRPMRSPDRFHTTRTVKSGAFYDEISVGGELIFDRHSQMDFSENGLSASLHTGIRLEKQLALSDEIAEMRYRLTTPYDTTFTIRTRAEISGDYAAVLRAGRRALGFDGETSVRVEPQGARFELSASVPDALPFQAEGLLALIVGFEFQITVKAGETGSFSISLRRFAP